MKKGWARFASALLVFCLLFTACGLAEGAGYLVDQVRIHYVLEYLNEKLSYTGIGVADEDGCYQFTFNTEGLAQDLSNLFVQIGRNGFVWGNEETGLTEITADTLTQTLELMGLMTLTQDPEQLASLSAYLHGEAYAEDLRALTLLLQTEANRLAGLAMQSGLLVISEDGDFTLSATYEQLIQLFAQYLMQFSQDAAAMQTLCGLRVYACFGEQGAQFASQLPEAIAGGAQKLASMPLGGLTGGVYLYASSTGDVELNIEYAVYEARLNLAALYDSGDFTAQIAYENGKDTLRANLEWIEYDGLTFALTGDMGGAAFEAGLEADEDGFAARLSADPGDYGRYVDASLAADTYEETASFRLRTGMRMGNGRANGADVNLVYANGALRGEYTQEMNGAVSANHQVLITESALVYNGAWTSRNARQSASLTITREDDLVFAEFQYFAPTSRYSSAPSTVAFSATADLYNGTFNVGGVASRNMQTTNFDATLDENGLIAHIRQPEFQITAGIAVEPGINDVTLRAYVDYAGEQTDGETERMLDAVLTVNQENGYAFTANVYEFVSDGQTTEKCLAAYVNSGLDRARWTLDYGVASGETASLLAVFDVTDEEIRVVLSGSVNEAPVDAEFGVKKQTVNAQDVRLLFYIETREDGNATRIEIPLEATTTADGTARLQIDVNRVQNGTTQRLGGFLLETGTTRVPAPAHVSGEKLSAMQLAQMLAQIANR